MLEKLRSFLFPKDTICIGCGALRVDDTAWCLCRACAESAKPLEPPFCPRCGQPGWAMLCPACMSAAPGALDGRFSGYPYHGIAGQLVRALKYQSVEPAVELLADGMAQAMPKETFDALIPVPLYWTRLRIRGFNQSQLLAEALSSRIGIPVLSALKRIRSTGTQTRLSAEKRAQNVRDAFQVIQAVQGQSLLLVDDVLTTGATATACAEALKEAGAARVFLAAAALSDPSLSGG